MLLCEERLIALAQAATCCLRCRGARMTSESDDLGKALQENLKPRRELASDREARAKNLRLFVIACRQSLARSAMPSLPNSRASMSTAVVESMTLDGAPASNTLISFGGLIGAS